ncbi:TPA: HAD hydrolase family protein [Candidatus Galligastranaerophilus gallistercoris]|nr:HAD hydrolase family protein [Candidatus Galligastranaerophilus gallistercoris]
MLKLSKNIKMVISDFDGVFTDGSVYFDEKLNQQKRMNFSDIMGVSILIKKGIKFAIVSGENTNILNYFKEKFGIEDIYGLIRKKGEIVEEILKKYNLKKDEVLYIGDDINDIPAFELVQYRVAPNNANPLIKMMDNMQITDSKGGEGAFREMVDSLVNQ